MAKSLTRTGLAGHGQFSRACAADDLLGNWQLVAFDSSYRFRNPQAPYLFPHQAFQYSQRGGVKSAHSLQPLSGDPDQLFEAVPSDMTYRVERKGRVVLKAKAHDETVETWSCRVITEDPEGMGDRPMLQRGDLVMTLMGKPRAGVVRPPFEKTRRITRLAWSGEACYYRHVSHASGTTHRPIPPRGPWTIRIKCGVSRRSSNGPSCY